ncbi:MAG: helix-turn-helix domain-containing protein [Candidatus Thermoplasmatota archaeon]|nr:helix-turn-helix domain-containing protein [Candidatus Thermoplasmatota archaeon]
MKRATVAYRPKDLRGIGYEGMFKTMVRMSVVSQIALMPEKTALIVVIKWRAGPDLTWLRENPLIDEVVNLGPVKEGHMYLLLGNEEPWYFEMLKMIMEEYRVFFDLPVVMEQDRIVVRYFGFLRNISRLMELSKRFNADSEIIALTDYDPSKKGAMDSLTAIQFDYLTEAFEKGFFDDSRGVTLADLAKNREVSTSSYMKTLRRAQRKLISAVFDRA